MSRILVKLKHGCHDCPTHLVPGSKVIKQHLNNLHLVEIPPGETPEEAIEKFTSHEVVKYAEPDHVWKADAPPNDNYYASGMLWGLSNNGDNDGTIGADISAGPAWEIRHDSPNIIVGVLDSGIRLTHEDLTGNLWDDGSGLCGYNSFAPGSQPVDDNGHGTHVAGIIGAIGNNIVGVVGVTWDVKLMILKGLGSDGTGSTSKMIECLEYAMAHGVNVINASLGGAPFSQSFYDILKELKARGILFIAAAGNDAEDNEVFPHYPGGYDLDNVIAVLATDRNDQLADFSNYGNISVDLGAPGVDIWSCNYASDTGYISEQGTSMATPYVTGAVAILKAQYPGESYVLTRRRLLDSVDVKEQLQGTCSTGGRLNLLKALNYYVPPGGIPVAAILPSNVPLPYIDYSGAVTTTTINSPMESSGVIKRRRRSSYPYQPLNVSWVLTIGQYDFFQEFFRYTLSNGGAAFLMEVRYPRNTILQQWVCRFMGGYTADYMDGTWKVEAQLCLMSPADLPDVSILTGYLGFYVRPETGETDHSLALPLFDADGSPFYVLEE